MSVNNANELYRELRQKLAAAGIPDALEARVIFESSCGFDARGFGQRKLESNCAERARALAQKRIEGYPLQYIAGRWPFLDFELELGEGVLIPRPETEDVALLAISLLKDIKKPTVLDLCSGSGCLAIAIARARFDALITALEQSADALTYLRRNAQQLAPAINVARGDVFAFQDELADESVDLIVSNPPYVREADYAALQPELHFEPKQALVGGADGLDFYRHIAPGYFQKLKRGGALLFEVGFDEAETVAEICAAAGYKNAEIMRDRYGKNRAVTARK